MHPIAAVQNEYSLLYRKDGEETLQATAASSASRSCAYAPLGRSMLTGTVHGKADLPEGDRRLAHPRFQGEALDKNVELVKRLEAIAREKRCTAAAARARLAARRRARTSCRSPAPSASERIDENLRRST